MHLQNAELAVVSSEYPPPQWPHTRGRHAPRRNVSATPTTLFRERVYAAYVFTVSPTAGDACTCKTRSWLLFHLSTHHHSGLIRVGTMHPGGTCQPHLRHCFGSVCM